MDTEIRYKGDEGIALATITTQTPLAQQLINQLLEEDQSREFLGHLVFESDVEAGEYAAIPACLKVPFEHLDDQESLLALGQEHNLNLTVGESTNNGALMQFYIINKDAPLEPSEIINTLLHLNVDGNDAIVTKADYVHIYIHSIHANCA